VNGARDGLKTIVKAAPIAPTFVAPSGLERREPKVRNSACITTTILSNGEGNKALEMNTATPKRVIRVILRDSP